MAKYFGTLFVRCSTNNYKKRVYKSRRNPLFEIRVRTLSEMQF